MVWNKQYCCWPCENRFIFQFIRVYFKSRLHFFMWKKIISWTLIQNYLVYHLKLPQTKTSLFVILLEVFGAVLLIWIKFKRFTWGYFAIPESLFEHIKFPISKILWNENYVYNQGIVTRFQIFWIYIRKVFALENCLPTV